MFSFFKKSKKDTTDASPSKEKKSSKERELKSDQCVVISSPQVAKDAPCIKNKSQKCEITPAGGVRDSAGDTSSKNATFPPITNGNPFVDNANVGKKSTQNPEENDQMFSPTIKRSPDSGQTHSVKPCGHGTVAISPRVPPQAIETPPDSPRLEIRRRKSKDIVEGTIPIQSKEIIDVKEADKKKNGDVSPQEQFFDANFDEDDV